MPLSQYALIVHTRQLPHYHYQKLPSHDIWGVILPTTDPLAQKDSTALEDIQHLPLILSRQVLTKTQSDNQLVNWLGDLNQLNIVTTFNLSYNALFMIEEGLGYLIGFDQLTYNPNLTFRPLEPLLTSDHYFVGKKVRYSQQQPNYFWKNCKVKTSKRLSFLGAFLH